MKRIVRIFSLMLTMIAVILTTSCTDKDHVATANVEIKLSDAVAKVADLTINYKLLNDELVTDHASKTYSKTFRGTMSEDEKGDFLLLAVNLDLKDNYREVIRKMSTSELNTFYNGCSFSSDLKVEIDKEPALNTKVGNTYFNEMPNDGIITAERIIQTLEQHANENSGNVFAILNIKKDGATWRQIGILDPWCEKLKTEEKD